MGSRSGIGSIGFLTIAALAPVFASALSLSPEKQKQGEKQLRASCTACHNLDAIQARRLSREDWNLEVGKMEMMGAQVRNRKLLLDYLQAVYGPKRN